MSAVTASCPKSAGRGLLPTPFKAFFVPEAYNLQNDVAPIINNTWLSCWPIVKKTPGL
jgi:hypothetical protein